MTFSGGWNVNQSKLKMAHLCYLIGVVSSNNEERTFYLQEALKVSKNVPGNESLIGKIGKKLRTMPKKGLNN